MYLGLVQVWWTFALQFPFMYLFGLFIIEQPTEHIGLFGMIRDESDRPVMIIHTLEVRKKEGRYWLIPSIREFFTGKITELEIPRNAWWFEARGALDRVFYVLDVLEMDGRMVVQPAPIHIMKVEEWRCAELEVENLARAYHTMTERYIRTRGELEVRSISHGMKFTRELTIPILIALGRLFKQGIRKREMEVIEEHERAGSET